MSEEESVLAIRAKRLEKLMEVSLYLSSTLDLSVLLRRVVAVSSVLQAEGASIILVDEERGELYFYQVHDDRVARALKPVTLKMGEGIAGYVAETGEALIINDVQSDPRFSPKADAQTGWKTRSMIAVPLRIKDRIIGVMEVINKIEGEFSGEDALECMALASIAAVSIQNARLHEETMANLQRIRDLEASKTEMITLLSHELRNPVTSIRGFADQLHKSATTFKPGTVKEYSRIILGETDHLIFLLNDLTILNEAEEIRRSLKEECVDVKELVSSTVQAAMHKYEPPEIHLLVEPAPENQSWKTRLDPEKIRHCLNHLLDNAVKFAPNGGTTRVTLRMLPPDFRGVRRVEIEVADEGIGIPLEEQEKIFEKFYQVDMSDSRDFEGLGVGLYICRLVAEAHGGEVTCESEPGRGSRFFLRLPIR